MGSNCNIRDKRTLKIQPTKDSLMTTLGLILSIKLQSYRSHKGLQLSNYLRKTWANNHIQVRFAIVFYVICTKCITLFQYAKQFLKLHYLTIII